MKDKKKMKSVVLVVLAVLFTAVLAVSLYRALTIYIPQKQEQKRFSELRKTVENEEAHGIVPLFEELKSKNSDFVGWLNIPDTVIDYPVVKHSEDDAEYYLHRDFDKNYSFAGTPFIGEGCDADSDIFIIYAHNMKADTMFGTLDSYADESFAKEHRDIYFCLPGEWRTYRVFAAFRTKLGTDDEFRYYEKVGVRSEEERETIIGEIAEHSVIETGDLPPADSQILMLSTCSYHTENGRFVVVAYRVD